MNAMLRNFVWISAWVGAFWGVLQLAQVRTSWDHAACGPWGCGPTATALVSCHAAWFMVLLPVSVAGNRRLSGDRRRQLGLALVALAAATLVDVISREAATWLPAASDYQRPYFIHRCLFVVASWTDFPIVQMGLLGAIWLFTAETIRRGTSAGHPAQCACDCDQQMAPQTIPQRQSTR